MASLIVGHTTETIARIWVRGDGLHQHCRIVLEADREHGDQRSHTADVSLSADSDNTAIADLHGLAAGTTYEVTATFSPSPRQRVRGRVRTVPRAVDGKPLEFSFVLSSCNLSIISINNLLAYLLAAGGTTVGASSLDLPIDRWMHPRLAWLWRVLRYPIKWSLYGVAWVIRSTTAVKQPGPPPLRSPFLKLSAVFDSWLLEYRGDQKDRPAAGDTLITSSGRGVVACSVKDLAADTHDRWQVVITQVTGTLQAGEDLFKRALMADDDQTPWIGRVTACREQDAWYPSPAFFLHVGDQIYYDFPRETRAPARDDYRVAYREAWFDDGPTRHVLANWPHYMTLDDHEIADQFARDFNPPSTADADTYFEEAMAAYDEYVRRRNPSSDHTWYRFEKGDASFFVLDTRSERFVRRGQIIGYEQMAALLQWMTANRRKLKFVISSVPFVAEINVARTSASAKWYPESATADGGRPANGPLNPVDDKWTAFEQQRDVIIDYVCRHDIENLVFLTGDMHCCYHASMRVGTSKYGSTTIHELAGGPVNQLELSDVTEFHTMVRARTAAGTPYEVALDRFHGALSAVMHVEVKYVPRPRVLRSDERFAPEVEWNVIRTLTDNGPSDWVDNPERPMAGRISFLKKRQPDDLLRW